MISKADIIKLDMKPSGSQIFPLERVLFETDQGNVSIAMMVAPAAGPQLCLRLPDDSVLLLNGVTGIEDVEILMELVTDYIGNY